MIRIILLIDALINLVLGVLLLLFSTPLVTYLGIPSSSTQFYPNILGAIFIGITIALLLEVFKGRSSQTIGLGFAGAISINLCGGVVLALWLIMGDLHLPPKGNDLLWAIVGLLFIVCLFELFVLVKQKYKNER